MDPKVIDEILDALLTPLETAESRSAALLELLRESGTIADEQLAPFLEQAENASEIKSRALRLRLKRILTSVIPQPEQSKKEGAAQTSISEAKAEEPKDETEGKPAPETKAADHQDDQSKKEETADSHRQEFEGKGEQGTKVGANQLEPTEEPTAPKKRTESESNVRSEKKAKK